MAALGKTTLLLFLLEATEAPLEYGLHPNLTVPPVIVFPLSRSSMEHHISAYTFPQLTHNWREADTRSSAEDHCIHQLLTFVNELFDNCCSWVSLCVSLAAG
jgi:hypothetical protein